MPPSILPTLERLVQALDEDLRERRDRGVLRTLTTIQAVRGSEVCIDNQWLVCWCSNDYLGFSLHPRLIRAASEAAQRWGVGSRASRLLAGSTQLHEQLEAALASFFGAEAAVVFASGYLANLGALSSLLSPHDVVLVDRLAHASLIEACRASRANLRVFAHNDVDQLAKLLARSPRARRRLIVTEGLFSMDGDFSPLVQLLELAHSHEAFLYVDDAHGAFVVGATGRGSPERAGVPHEAMIYMGTLGKALGTQGGFVVGPRALIAALHNRARSFVYATALACPVAAAAHEALQLLQEDETARQRLGRTVEQFHARLGATAGMPPQDPSHIVPIVIGSSQRACEVSARLRLRGMFVPAIRSPTVPHGTARLRVSLTALHTDAQIDELAHVLRDELRLFSSSAVGT